MFEWIAVGVEWPVLGMAVLLCVAPSPCDVIVGFRDKGQWFALEGYPLLDGSVTHWGYFPRPPQA